MSFEEFDAMDYSYADERNALQIRSNPEQGLWCAVIHQAFTDAMGGDRAARDWLLCEREDFVTVCTLAGISPFCVRSAARRKTAPHFKH